MTETQVSELMLKGLMSEMPQNEQAQVQELLVDMNNAMAKYPETVRAVSMAFIALQLAKM